MVATKTEPRKRDIALAFIIERIARAGVPPSLAEIARELKVSVARVKVLLDQLEREGKIERTSGAVRGIRVRDVAGCRDTLMTSLQNLGWVGPLALATFPHGHLPMLPELEYLPDVD